MAQIYYMGVPYGGRTTGGGSGNATWGNIGGVLANQTDLKAALDAKSAVAANPTLEGGESNLSSIEIDGTKYSVPSGGGSPYVLPQATESALGGVKASERTTEDNEVKIDATTGKLYASSGGGGGGSTEWGQITGTLANQTDLKNALDAKASAPSSETVTVSGGTASKQLTSHKLCVFDGAVLTLTITLPATVSASDEFNFVFETSSNGCTLTVPNTVKWDGGTAPTLEANKMYEVSIDGLGIALISQGVSTTT